MYVIAGLGNPGLKYRKTRHNAGFDAIDEISDRYSIPVKKDEFKAKTGRGRIGAHDVLLVKPQTYMNNSGESLQEICHYYKIDPAKELIVLSDDVTLDPGRMRIRVKGSAGGHNGLKSIISCCNTDQFLRVRIGVGKLPEGGDMVAHVLGHLPKEERLRLEEICEDAADAVVYLMDGKIDDAMTKFNGLQR